MPYGKVLDQKRDLKSQQKKGCSGPSDNARTTPEWLKKIKMKKLQKSYFFKTKIGLSCNSCSTNNL